MLTQDASKSYQPAASILRASISIVRTSTMLIMTMGLSKKRKQQLIQMFARAAESHKHRKLDRENERKKRFLKKQREEEDFRDEYEEPLSESSSDESNVESSLDESSSEEGDLGWDNVRGDNTLEGLGDDGAVQLEVKEHSFKPVWKDDAGSYLRGIQGCGSSATTKREKRRKQEMEKSVSGSRSIVEMFFSQQSKNQSCNQDSTSDFAPVLPLSTELKGKKF